MRIHRLSPPVRPLAALVLLAGLAGLVSSPTWADPPAARAAAGAGALPKNAQHYLRFSYPAAMAVPVPAAVTTTGLPLPLLTQLQGYRNAAGQLGIYQSQGEVDASRNAFFQSLGSNGRSCFSCHRPGDGMSVNTGTLRQLFAASAGTDPVFAPVDGANCPSAVKPARGASGTVPPEAYSLLLNRGLFRVFLPVPAQAEFTVTVVSDPYGCNTDPTYATQIDPSTQEVRQMVSVYRRPRMSANLKFAVTPALTLGGGGLPNIDFITGLPVLDPRTGLEIGGNIMWDGREPTLESQAVSATLGHAQALRPPTEAQVAEIVSFEMGVFAAQLHDKVAGSLATSGPGATVAGGPQAMAELPVSFGIFTLYEGWYGANPADGAAATRRASIARGQALFNDRPINVSNVAGFNNAVLLGVTNPSTATCGSCHGNLQAGFDPLPAGQRDIGIGGHAEAFGGPAPSPELPIFRLSCKSAAAGAYNARTVLTNDPGQALITGRCADIGRRSVPQLRGLAARAPFFSDGSAATVEDTVKFYDKRFNMGLTPADITDLANFLRAL
jgi:hypothetical protein